MENNETKTFRNDAEKSDKREKTNKNTGDMKLAGASAFGGIAGGGISAIAAEIRHSEEPELMPDPEPEPAPDPTPDPTPKPDSDPKPDPTPMPEPDPDVVPDPIPATDPEEPVLPVEEIDPFDIDAADYIEDVTNVEVVYDINGNPMVVATAHNSVDGEFYLVDADADGDFDVILDEMGNPVVDLTGENDQLVTLTDVETQMNEDYVAPTDMDDMIAQQNMIGEDIQHDITVIDDNNA